MSTAMPITSLPMYCLANTKSRRLVMPAKMAAVTGSTLFNLGHAFVNTFAFACHLGQSLPVITTRHSFIVLAINPGYVSTNNSYIDLPRHKNASSMFEVEGPLCICFRRYDDDDDDQGAVDRR